MAPLRTYHEFLDRVEALGFFPMGRFVPGMPSLAEETTRAQWHTGDPVTDPWLWKDRAAQEKRLAYGCILNGDKGFIAPRMYALFYAAYHPEASMLDRRQAGEISHNTWRVWQVFEQRRPLNTSDVRRALGARGKSKAAGIDAALAALQREFWLAVAGSRQKISQGGKMYGWPANLYDRVTNWAPPEWLPLPVQMTAPDARAAIVECGLANGRNVDRQALEKRLFA